MLPSSKTIQVLPHYQLIGKSHLPAGVSEDRSDSLPDEKREQPEADVASQEEPAPFQCHPTTINHCLSVTFWKQLEIIRQTITELKAMLSPFITCCPAISSPTLFL